MNVRKNSQNIGHKLTEISVRFSALEALVSDIKYGNRR
jgi:hypothetical protein